MTADWKQGWVARACSECGHELLVPVAPAALLDAAIRERDEARAERDRLRADLALIAGIDPIDAVLDPDRALRDAEAALAVVLDDPDVSRLIAERDRYKAALEYIRDHGKTHDQPCFALSNGDCAEVMQECADAVLAVPAPPTTEGTP